MKNGRNQFRRFFLFVFLKIYKTNIMKKFRATVILLLMCVCALAVSCSKYNPMSDTRWVCDEGELNLECSFTDHSFLLYFVDTKESYEGTYSYSKRNLYFVCEHYYRTSDEIYDGGGEFSGHVKGGSMVLDVFGLTLDFHKM